MFHFFQKNNDVLPEYEVIRSKRKTICIEITRDGRTLVRAPLKVRQDLIETFVLEHKDWIAAKLQWQAERQKQYTLTDDRVEALRKAAKEYIPKRVEELGAVMKLTPTAVKITSAKTRFGSCSGKNALCFSLYLMQYPPELVDYVIVHELAHIAHHNHSKQFYALIERYMPDYKLRQKRLKQGAVTESHAE